MDTCQRHEIENNVVVKATTTEENLIVGDTEMKGNYNPLLYCKGLVSTISITNQNIGKYIGYI